MKTNSTNKFISYQFLILGGFILLTVLNETVDLPHLLFADPANSGPPRWGEVALEMGFSLFVILVEIAFIQKLRCEIRVLEGCIPICAECKQIRDEDNRWKPIESYISRKSHAEFSHGLCPHCAVKLFPEFAEPVLVSPTRSLPKTNADGETVPLKKQSS